MADRRSAVRDRRTAISRSPHLLVLLAAINALAALGFGAFGAHLLKDLQAREWVSTGVLFQLPSAVAVLAILGWRDSPRSRAAAWLIGLGALAFAGGLDALAGGAPRSIAAVIPAGGALMILGWLVLAYAALAARDG